jgi:hypothetical protein
LPALPIRHEPELAGRLRGERRPLPEAACGSAATTRAAPAAVMIPIRIHRCRRLMPNLRSALPQARQVSARYFVAGARARISMAARAALAARRRR